MESQSIYNGRYRYNLYGNIQYGMLFAETQSTKNSAIVRYDKARL